MGKLGRKLQAHFELIAQSESKQRVQNPSAIRSSHEYHRQNGLQPPKPHKYVNPDPAMLKNMANYFDKVPSQPEHPEVQQSYKAFVSEIEKQFNHLSKEIQVEPWDDISTQPYKNSKEMMDDVMYNHHMYVYMGGMEHDILTPEQNFKFRAVHDYYGHAQYGYEFGPKGEFNATIEHSKMFTPEAQQALVGETTMQNAWVNYGPHANLPVEKRPYAEQKALPVPPQFVNYITQHYSPSQT